METPPDTLIGDNAPEAADPDQVRHFSRRLDILVSKIGALGYGAGSLPRGMGQSVPLDGQEPSCQPVIESLAQASSDLVHSNEYLDLLSAAVADFELPSLELPEVDVSVEDPSAGSMSAEQLSAIAAEPPDEKQHIEEQCEDQPPRACRIRGQLSQPVPFITEDCRVPDTSRMHDKPTTLPAVHRPVTSYFPAKTLRHDPASQRNQSWSSKPDPDFYTSFPESHSGPPLSIAGRIRSTSTENGEVYISQPDIAAHYGAFRAYKPGIVGEPFSSARSNATSCEVIEGLQTPRASHTTQRPIGHVEPSSGGRVTAYRHTMNTSPAPLLNRLSTRRRRNKLVKRRRPLATSSSRSNSSPSRKATPRPHNAFPRRRSTATSRPASTLSGLRHAIGRTPQRAVRSVERKMSLLSCGSCLFSSMSDSGDTSMRTSTSTPTCTRTTHVLICGHVVHSIPGPCTKACRHPTDAYYKGWKRVVKLDSKLEFRCAECQRERSRAHLLDCVNDTWNFRKPGRIRSFRYARQERKWQSRCTQLPEEKSKCRLAPLVMVTRSGPNQLIMVPVDFAGVCMRLGPRGFGKWVERDLKSEGNAANGALIRLIGPTQKTMEWDNSPIRTRPARRRTPMTP